MRKIFGLAIIVGLLSLSVWSQSKPSTTTAPRRTPAAAGAEDTPDPIAVIDTTAGKINCTLFPKKAPIGVANFIGLATGTKDWTDPVTHAKKHGVPLYDGTIFHRVIPEFMIQGGDPAGSGMGNPGYRFKNETSPDLAFDRPGRLAYANAGPNTNSSQFFITEVATPHLNGGYTLFGQCDDEAVTLVKQIARMARDPSNDRPFRPVKINHITIIRGGAGAAKPAGTSVKKPPRAATPKAAASPN